MANKLFGIVNLTKILLFIIYSLLIYILAELITIPKFNRRKKAEVLTNIQIIKENSQTKTYYFGLVLITNGFYYSVVLIAAQEWCVTTNMVMLLISKMAYIVSVLIMIKVSTPKYSKTGELISPGADLNETLPNSIKEAAYIVPMVNLSKDLIILSAVVQVLSLISIYFWFLWTVVLARLLVPCFCWVLKEILLHDMKWHEDRKMKKYVD